MPDNAEANAALFSPTEGLTLDDVVVVPGWSTTLPDEVDTSTVFAAGIELAVPLVSAAMDKVTEARMAIAMARVGGIGVIHRNMSAEAQAAEVQKVKRSQSGMITDPVTLPVTATLADAEALMHRFKFSGVPITSDEGRLMRDPDRRRRRRLGPDLGLHEPLRRRQVDAIHEVREELERLFLVLEQRVLLTVGAQSDAFPQAIE